MDYWTNEVSPIEPFALYYCMFDLSWIGYIKRVQAATKADSNGNILNFMSGLPRFSGTDLLLFEDWHEKTSTVVSLTRSEIFELMEM